MTTIVQPVIERSGQGARSYVEWSAVIAGAVLASAISFTLLAFGTGIAVFPHLSVSWRIGHCHRLRHRPGDAPLVGVHVEFLRRGL